MIVKTTKFLRLLLYPILIIFYSAANEFSFFLVLLFPQFSMLNNHSWTTTTVINKKCACVIFVYFQFSLNPLNSFKYRFPGKTFKSKYLLIVVYMYISGCFLIPYLICLVVAGVPVLVLEIALGQYTSQGAITAWKICPLFQGTNE